MTFAKKDRNTAISVFMMFALSLFLGGVIFFIMASNQKIFASKYSVYMFLPNVEGLVPGAFVTLSGLKIGIVGELEFSEKDSLQGINIELKIDRSYENRITASSFAEIKTMGILGDKYVDITLGSLSEPPLGEGGYIRGSEGINTGELFADVADAMSELKKVLRNTEVLTREATEGRGVMGQLFVDKSAGQDFAALIKNLKHTTDKIVSGQGSLGKLVNDNTLYASLTENSQSLHAILDSLQTGKGTLAKLLNDEAFYQRIASVATQTDSLLYRLQHEGTVAKLLKDEQFYKNLVTLTASLDSLSTDMKKNPGKYVKFSLF